MEEDSDALPSYGTVHSRLKQQRGRASEYLCMKCGKPAKDWAYLYGAGLSYSANLEDYAPMCRPCHKLHDLTPEQRSEVARKGHLSRGRPKKVKRPVGHRKGEPWSEARRRAQENLDEIGLSAMKAAGKKSTSYRWTCEECGRKMSPANLGRHQKAKGHQGTLI